MAKPARENYLSIKTIINLIIKNIFSIFYFVITGILLAVVYTNYLVRPTYLATGTINNTSSQNSITMTNVVNTVKEHLTIDKAIEKMNIAEEYKQEKKSEILAKLNAYYNTTTFKVIISFSTTDKAEAVMVVDYVIDATLERYFEANPALEGKIARQTNPISATATGFSNRTIYMVFVFGGAALGVILGVGTDLFNRKLFFYDDLDEYGLPTNIMDLKLNKESKVTHLESLHFKNSLVVLGDRLEGSARRKKVKVIGVVNLGYETYNGLSSLLGENSAIINQNTLVIDLDLEKPNIHELYNLSQSSSIVNIISSGEYKPIKVKDNLHVLPAVSYSYPARFLKDERLKNAIDKYAKEYDNIFINLPVTDYYAPIALNFGLIDILLINTSFGGTKLKVLDRYIENIDEEGRGKLFINAIDSRVKKNFIGNFLKNFKKSKKSK